MLFYVIGQVQPFNSPNLFLNAGIRCIRTKNDVLVAKSLDSLHDVIPLNPLGAGGIKVDILQVHTTIAEEAGAG